MFGALSIRVQVCPLKYGRESELRKGKIVVYAICDYWAPMHIRINHSHPFLFLLGLPESALWVDPIDLIFIEKNSIKENTMAVFAIRLRHIADILIAQGIKHSG